MSAADVLSITDPPAAFAPLPHAAAPVAGLVWIGGHAVVALDLTAPDAVGALVTVAAGNGGLALCVGSVRRDDDRDGSVPALADLLARAAPWAPPPVTGHRLAIRPAATAIPARGETFLLVACGDTVAALPAGRIGRVGVAASVQPLRDGSALVRVDGELLAARHLASSLPLAGGDSADPRWVVVLSGGLPALLVDRVLGLESCDAGHIATVTLPDGRRQRWLNRAERDPVPVTDGSVTDGAGTADEPPPPDGDAPALLDPVLTVLSGDLRLALPLAAIERIVGSGGAMTPRPTPGRLPVFDSAVILGRRSRPRVGTLIHLRAADTPLLLSVDRVLGLGPLPAPWQTIAPLPPDVASAIDAAAPDGDGWLLRPVLPAPTAPPLPRHRRRALAMARLGWAAPDAFSA